jgi:NAD(P)-dependent dehydrogenase (short-subunit alcohol dehydrogenase family)
MDAHDLFSLEGRVAVVTGGSSGIGRHIALGLAAAGARVYICARNEIRLQSAASEIASATGASIIAIVADVSTVDGVEMLVSRVSALEGALHILVNNAGTISEAPLETYSETEWDAVVNLNMKMPFFTIQKFLALLRAGGNSDHPASVIHIGSMGALRVGSREVYAYQASKAGSHWLAKSLARKLGPDNVTVNVIAPGFFESDMTVISSREMRDTLNAMIPRGRIGIPEDVAGTAIYLASRAGSYVTGAVIPLEGGLSS